MNTKIKVLSEDQIKLLDSNYVSNMLQLAYMRHERFGDGRAMTLQILLELQALITDEIASVEDVIIDNELDQLWTITVRNMFDAGGRSEK
jgi:hypothetical protein